MKRKLTTAVFLLCALFFLSACATGRKAAEEETLLLCCPSAESAVFLKEDGQTISVEFPDRGKYFFRTFVCGTDDTVFYAEYDETAAESEIRNRVYAVDAESGEELVIAETGRNIVMLEVYQGKLYVLEYDWRETSGSVYTERIFLPDGNGGFVETQENQYLYDILWKQGFSMMSGARKDGVDGFYTIAYCKNVLGEILLRSENPTTDVIALFDTEGVFSKEISLEEKYGFLAADEQYVVSRSGDGGVVLYCRATGEKERMQKEQVDTILTLSKGAVFYAQKRQEEYGVEKISVYRYNIEEKERKLLYNTKSRPGYGEEFEPGIDGFILDGDFCYYIDTEDGAAAWLKRNVKDTDSEAMQTGAVAKRYGFTDYGTAVYKSETRNCPVCGKTVLNIYTEGFRLYDEIPFSKEMNRLLYKKLQNYSVRMDDITMTEISEAENCHEIKHEAYMDAAFLDVRLADVLFLRERYLQVSYDVYVYWGGAHGFGSKDYILFDMAHGEEICFAELYRGSEAELKRIAAKYTLESIRESGQAVSMDSAKEFYGEICRAVSYDRASFSENGVVITFEPYEFAEFGYRSYTVEIPYEELELAW